MWWPRCMTWQVSWYPWDTLYVFSTVLLVVWLLWTRDGLPSSARDGLPTATGFRRRASGEGRHENYLVFGRASGSPASLVCSPPGGAGFLPPSLTSGGQRFSPGESHARARVRCAVSGPLYCKGAGLIAKSSLQRGGLKTAQARYRSSPLAQRTTFLAYKASVCLVIAAKLYARWIDSPKHDVSSTAKSLCDAR